MLIAVVSLMQVIVRNIETLPALKWAEEFCRFCWIGSVFLSLPYWKGKYFHAKVKTGGASHA